MQLFQKITRYISVTPLTRTQYLVQKTIQIHSEKMLSNRIYSLVDMLTKYGCKINACTLKFNKDRKLFGPAEDTRIFTKFRMIYFGEFLWILLSLGILMKHYNNKDWNKFFMSLLHWFTVVSMHLCLSILRFRVEDFTRAANGALMLYQQIQG